MNDAAVVSGLVSRQLVLAIEDEHASIRSPVEQLTRHRQSQDATTNHHDVWAKRHAQSLNPAAREYLPDWSSL